MNEDLLSFPVNILVYVCAAVMFVVLVTKGPGRALKISLVVFVLGFVGWIGLTSGWGTALTVLAVIFGINIVSMSAAALLHRMPLKKHLRPVEYATACPSHGVRKLQDWTRGFEAAGFDAVGDYEAMWTFASTKRRVLIRFLLHRSRESWVEIHILDEPKMAARMIAARKEAGLYLGTCDRQANEEFFRDRQTHVRRVPSRSTCADMIRSHEKFVLETPGSLLRTEDPVSAHVEIYDGWIRRLLDSQQLVVRGHSVSIPLRLVLPAAFRVMGAWFH